MACKSVRFLPDQQHSKAPWITQNGEQKYREELFDDDFMIIAECSKYTLVGNRKDLHDPYVGNLSERTCDCWYPIHH